MYKDGASFQGTMTKLPEQKQKQTLSTAQNTDLFFIIFIFLNDKNPVVISFKDIHYFVWSFVMLFVKR